LGDYVFRVDEQPIHVEDQGADGRKAAKDKLASR
jgi:hypothetical protein